MYRKPQNSNKGIETKTLLFNIPEPCGCSSSMIGSNVKQRDGLL